MANLHSLPPEILEQVIQYLPTAYNVARLSETSKAIHNVVQKEGWRAFVAYKFPSIPVPPLWQDAAHALTTLSRNLDRRAFIAQEVEPYGQIHSLPSGHVLGRWERPKGQTMGYQAVLDTYEELTTNKWSSAKRIVAWGAGAELVMGISGLDTTTIQQATRTQRPTDNAARGVVDLRATPPGVWLSYREKHHAQGRDDITTVNLLRSGQHVNDEKGNSGEELVLGRANGELCAVRISLPTGKCHVRRYETASSSVRSTDVSSSQHPLLASCLGDDRLVLYPVHSHQESVGPTSETCCVTGSQRNCRTWSTKFLSHDMIAIGMGPSTETVKVFQVTGDGLSREPVRCFRSGKAAPTSAYPVRALPNSTCHGPGVRQDLILSGNYDGTIRLHDLRSPQDHASLIRDPVDDSAVFSLETVGRERIVAGCSSHSLLKVFDLRMTGGRAYQYHSLPEQQQSSPGPDQNDMFRESDNLHSSGFNVFVGQNRQIPSSRRRQPKESPIYSLSRPSPQSPMLYAGLENSVVSFNFTSAADPHPDPLFDGTLRWSRGVFDPLSTWFSNPPFALTLYEHMGSRNMRMLYQRNLGHHRSGLSVQSFEDSEPGYDERLSTISTSTRLSAARSSFGR